MAFQTKDFRSIVAAMINTSRANGSRVTDFSVGSVARTLMEAPAIEIEELYLQMLLGLQESIPTAVFTSFNFERLAAVSASGTVRFTCVSSASAIRIPAGTRVKSDSSALEYATQVDAPIAAGGTYADVQVACTTTGLSTNCAAGTLTTMVSPVAGIVSVTNLAAFLNGADVEADAARKTRFHAYIASLSRGTVAALQYGASRSVVRNASGDVIERAAHVAVIEPYLTNPTEPTALVNVYIHNGTGVTSLDLVAAVSQDLHGYVAPDGTLVTGWKAAGVKLNVFAATEISINITATIAMVGGASNAAALVTAQAAVADYITSLGIGEPVIRSELVSRVMGISGVYNVTMTDPANDVAITATQKVVPGTVTLS